MATDNEALDEHTAYIYQGDQSNIQRIFNAVPEPLMQTPTKITMLWCVVLFNMAFADILGFLYPGFLAEIGTGQAGQITITPAFLVVAAVFIEIAIIMVYLTRALSCRASRRANLIAAPVTIAFVIGGGSGGVRAARVAAGETGAKVALAEVA